MCKKMKKRGNIQRKVRAQHTKCIYRKYSSIRTYAMLWKRRRRKRNHANCTMKKRINITHTHTHAEIESITTTLHTKNSENGEEDVKKASVILCQDIKTFVVVACFGHSHNERAHRMKEYHPCVGVHLLVSMD